MKKIYYFTENFFFLSGRIIGIIFWICLMIFGALFVMANPIIGLWMEPVKEAWEIIFLSFIGLLCIVVGIMGIKIWFKRK
ncbi:MAG TPA: hypothetical protein P5060_01980 [Candidatus Absconditabacterales bacterium]|nr:hypothetical protein [Candidatus Absconditabacterales bacterium]